MGVKSNGFSWNPLNKKSKNCKDVSLIHLGLCKGVITFTRMTNLIGIWLSCFSVKKYINVTSH